MTTIASRASRTAAALVASIALLGVAACGGPEIEPSSDGDATSATPAETSAPAAEETEAPAAAGGQPAWAQTPTAGGEKISTITAGDITVDVYEIGITQATKTGQFVDPDTNKPLVDVGDDIVFVNYVITNNGAAIDLGSSLVDVEARYDDWKYLQGMDSIVDDTLYEQQGVNDDSLAPGGFNDAGIYTLGAGESYSYGDNFFYQKDSPITFKVSVTPVDAEGELLHDNRLEGEGKGTIK